LILEKVKRIVNNSNKTITTKNELSGIEYFSVAKTIKDIIKKGKINNGIKEKSNNLSLKLFFKINFDNKILRGRYEG
tara:strand:- start:254 stop:484 length:231 start_codon:yes stop_codon:yes gene_type:complete